MKRVLLVTMLVAGMLMLSTGFALAGIHGPYSINTDACAGCHVTHTAAVAKLLRGDSTVNTQAKFCFICHGAGGPGAPYDVENGQAKDSAANAMVDSPAGGFDKTKFTSIHNVSEGVTAIPGGTNSITGGLVCGSCHNPHGSSNSRLLKEKIFGTTVTGVKLTVTNNINTAYVSGFNTFCGACHDKFNVGVGSGHIIDAEGMYRHAMGVAATLPSGGDFRGGDLMTGTPLESGKVSCMSCHRAHGTKAVMNGTYTMGKSSYLLRIDNRGVCYNCHGAAQYNLPQ